MLLFGLIAVGGTMLLVTQDLQLVTGFSPLIARRVRPGFVVTGALGLSVVGYLMLTQLDNSATGVVIVVVGFSFVCLGLGTIAALGTDIVVGSAPADKAGSSSAMSETMQDLDVSLGMAVLGSLATAIYRRTVLDRISESLGHKAHEAVADITHGPPFYCLVLGGPQEET